ncbi:MAG: ATP-binding protein [Chloroflexi bacterium]|nr:ATP-binding protein [Chloroflexota bacterium]
MNDLLWTPWHKVVRIRDDLRSRDLSLSIFAADLCDVVMGRAKPIYQDPSEFFALTYPTYNLRSLARDVVNRLAGRNDKAVHQLQLTYGGGKTHTLVTLFHLVNDPVSLPNLPAVQEFVHHIGSVPNRARVAALPFDRLDPVKGMEVRSPDGSIRRFTYPWSVLAFQLGGEDGLAIIGSTGAEEREEPPFTNVLEDLLTLPRRDGLSTLILIDEVLMWARTKVGADPVWRHRLQDFFQCLTQAATNIDRSAIVASLLATLPSKSDDLGKEITNELYAIFRRESEEGIQPVEKEDVAEVLRRRFFTADSVRDRESFRPHVVAALKGIASLDEQTAREGKSAEDHLLQSYPFHPDLTDVFYTKWTNLEGFQLTRGILRTFALALRDAEAWDDSPLVGANVFLSELRASGVSEAARELTVVAETETYEGKKQAWTQILDGELAKGRNIQKSFPGLRHREVEQAVFATFIHSQPVGRKALTRELMVLLGHTRPDKIELGQALQRWSEESWFLDESAISEVETGPGGQKSLPKSWRLGSKPNLRQMHHDACARVNDLVEPKLIAEIGNLKALAAGVSAAGGKAHSLPNRPSEVEDDGEFHFAVLGPKAASDVGKPSAEARRFVDETTGPDRPRVYRNALVLVVPSPDGLEAARAAVRDYLGWEEVRFQLKVQPVDPVRQQMLASHVEGARKEVPSAIQRAFSIVVTVSEQNEVQAFKIAVGGGPLFNAVKADARSRIQDTAISAEAMLPEGPYDLWREGDASRRVKDLVGAFAQFPRLPKMLNRKAILDTLVGGCAEGTFVLRLTRPDRSFRTFWRTAPDDVALKDAGLEVVLPEAATLSDLSPALLAPGVLPCLWKTAEVALKDMWTYFAGGHVVNIQREGYEEPVAVPKSEQEVIETAVRSAVKTGKLWLTSGPASILAEEIPAGLLTEDAILQAPPPPLSPLEVMPEALPHAWEDGTTTAMSIAVGLSKKVGKTLPWITVREAVDGAIRVRLLERTIDSGAFPCDFAGAAAVKLRIPSVKPAGTSGAVDTPPASVPPGALVAQAELDTAAIQDLADAIGELRAAAAGYDLKFRLAIELSGKTPPPRDVVDKLNKVLKDISANFQLRLLDGPNIA